MPWLLSSISLFIVLPCPAFSLAGHLPGEVTTVHPGVQASMARSSSDQVDLAAFGSQTPQGLGTKSCALGTICAPDKFLSVTLSSSNLAPK
jgi:hypothetical protein